MVDTNNGSGGIDREALWGDYQHSAREKDKIHRQLIRKSLNLIPEEEMQNVGNQTTTNNGLDWKSIAAMGTIGAGLLAGNHLLNREPVTPPTDIPPKAERVVTEKVDKVGYEIKFYDKDGNEIRVPSEQQYKAQNPGNQLGIPNTQPDISELPPTQ